LPFFSTIFVRSAQIAVSVMPPHFRATDPRGSVGHAPSRNGAWGVERPVGMRVC
jgi:hypothetical protein